MKKYCLLIITLALGISGASAQPTQEAAPLPERADRSGANAHTATITAQPLTVHPNPAAQQLQLSLPVAGVVTLMNARGQTVARVRPDAQRRIDVSALPTGLYVLRAGHFATRFVKE